ncbi:MAG TPA: hypothetical protein IAB68_00060 [Candidatus Aphodocola excrementigallinarum]|uniref:Uncharacterized protein n=1 Tax=Candidatus Aphodocola excrementigallinarum TaxID=2840670 RepID=A0A9D1IP65_9FIRM|nr:hypothetical protein [Candidatus Aphodocola excrementigallinarum]
MGVLKNDVGRPSKKTKIIRGILKLIGILIIIAAGLYIGYVIGNNQSKEEEKTDKNKTETKEKSKIEKVDTQKADQIMKNIFGEQYYYDFGYSDENNIIFNNNEYKTTVALENTKTKSSSYSCKDFFGDDINPIGDNQQSWFIETGDFRGLCYDEGGLDYYSYEDVNKTYKSKFDDGNNAVEDNINIIFTDLYGYSKEENAYVWISCECGDGGNMPVYGVTDSYIEKDELYINVVIGFAENIDVDNNILTLKDGTKVTLTDSELEDKELYKKYQDNLDKYTFKFSVGEDNYKFIEAEKAN